MQFVMDPPPVTTKRLEIFSVKNAFQQVARGRSKISTAEYESLCKELNVDPIPDMSVSTQNK